MPDEVFDVLRREPVSLAPPSSAAHLRARASRRTRSQVLGGGALGVAALAVAVGLAGAGTTEASSELVPAAPAVTAPAPSDPVPGVVPAPSEAAPTAAPAPQAPASTPRATSTPAVPGSTAAAALPAAPAPGRPPVAGTPPAPGTPAPGTPAPSTSPATPAPPVTPAPTPSTAALEAGRHQVRVVAAGWDDTGRHLLLDLGDFVWGEPVEPGVDSTAPLLWESGPVAERLRLDLAEGYDLRFSHAGDASSWGPGGWDDLVVEVDTRRLVGVVTVDDAGRVTAFEEPYRP